MFVIKCIVLDNLAATQVCAWEYIVKYNPCFWQLSTLLSKKLSIGFGKQILYVISLKVQKYSKTHLSQETKLDPKYYAYISMQF